MNIFRKKPVIDECYIWYDSDRKECACGNIQQFESLRSISSKAEDFKMICHIGENSEFIDLIAQNINSGEYKFC